MPSFDIQSEFDSHEVSNAVDQANREVTSRFDFKGADASFVLHEKTITLSTETEFQLEQMWMILKTKLTKRAVDIRHFQAEEATVGHKKAEQTITLQQGIDAPTAKKIIQAIKAAKLKAQASIQGEQVRVTGKKRDDLQAVIQCLKETDFGCPLSFGNFRD